MKKSAKKLRLSRETLHNLNEPGLRRAVGGVSVGTVCCTDPTICATNCTSCNQTDTCTHCSAVCGP
jgi:hypothetical protein